jgi:large subunit ribosomal protein L25
MKLSVFPRTSQRKSDPKKDRRAGKIPAILYGLDSENRKVCLNADELQAQLRKVRPGLLPTTVFEIQEGDKKYKAVLKEVQYHPVSYAVIHVDLALLSDNHPVTVKVPIQVAGAAHCIGIKGGGFLRQTIRFMSVSCLPKDIPEEFFVDVSDLNIAQSRTLGEIALPSGVRPLSKLNEVVVAIAKKA